MSTHTAWIVTGLCIIGIFALYFGYGDRVGEQQTMVDRHFIEQMIPHHEGAIEMAKLALEKSTRPEVLSLAQGIIEAQEKEVADMRAWYRDWFGREVPDDGGAMMGMDHMMRAEGMVGDFEALKTAADFDREFLSQMIVHHEMAVMMGQMLASGTARQEMRVLAETIITSQTREIELMRSWLGAQ